MRPARELMYLSLMLMTGTTLSTSAALAQDVAPDAIVDAFQAITGPQKARPSGAKGQCFTGTFVPTADAKRLSKAALFEKSSSVVARFSVGSGNQKVADGNKAVNRGLSFRIDEGGKGQSEFVMVNAPVFFAKSPAQMLAFLKARAPGADGKPDADKIKAFTEANPETTQQGRWLASKPVPASWVGVNYWGVHGYTLINGSGARQLIKFKMVPTGGEAGLTDDEAKAKPADYLVDELNARIAAKGPADFDMVAILGRPGDETTNATQTWSDEDKRPTVKLGTLTITALERNARCDEATFDPTILADGIEGPTNDPLFTSRQSTYAVSLTRRN